jgi:hypothetical protein
MATTTAKGSGVKKNNGGTIAYGGNVSASGPLSQVGFTTLNFENRFGGSKIPNAETDETIAAGTGTTGLYKPFSSGTYAYQVAGKYLIRGYTTTISGVANTVLQSGASDFGTRKSIMKIEQFRRTHEATWNWITGQPSTKTAETDYAGQSGTTDHAARPTRAIPGEFVIMETGTTPSYKDYSKKTD